MNGVNWTGFFSNFKYLAATAIGITAALVVILIALLWLYFVFTAPIKISHLAKAQNLLLKEIRTLNQTQTEISHMLEHMSKHTCKDHGCRTYHFEDDN